MHIEKDGTKRWWLHDKIHRTDGPAIEWANGTKVWYLNGRLHRTDGPAAEYSNGDTDWYLNGQHYSFDQWLDANPDMSDQQRVMFKLEYA